MFRILPKRMAFLTRRHRYLLLQWIVIVLSTLPAPVNSNGISATVTAIPQVTRPNSWVKLVCTFNLTDKDTSIVYWSDKNGDTLYVFEKGETPELQYGPLYKSPWASGRIENVTRHTGNHSLMLFVDGCAKSPYTCYIWKDAIELAKPLFVEIKHIPGPVFTIQGEQVNEIKIVENGTHILSCAIHETTAAHNLTMNVEINGVNQKDTSPRAGNYNITKCTYSSKLKKDYELLDSDKVQVQCIAKYATGEQLITTTRSPDQCNPTPCENGGTCIASDDSYKCQCPDNLSGEKCQYISMGGLTDLMLPPWLIIVIVIIIFLILIVIIITVIVMVVKKKKGWLWCVCCRKEKPPGNGTECTKEDFYQYCNNPSESHNHAVCPTSLETGIGMGKEPNIEPHYSDFRNVSQTRLVETEQEHEIPDIQKHSNKNDRLGHVVAPPVAEKPKRLPYQAGVERGGHGQWGPLQVRGGDQQGRGNRLDNRIPPYFPQRPTHLVAAQMPVAVDDREELESGKRYAHNVGRPVFPLASNQRY